MSLASGTPRTLFLVDAIGAAVSAIMLGVVLIQFQSLVGIPRETLYLLAIIPCFFAAFDAWSYFGSSAKYAPRLQTIAVLNTLYCALSLGLAARHQEVVTIWGWIYITGEIVIILALVAVQFRTAKTLKTDNLERG